MASHWPEKEGIETIVGTGGQLTQYKVVAVVGIDSEDESLRLKLPVALVNDFYFLQLFNNSKVIE